MIKDSGKRRKFESGAVRDIEEGKGRCDLLPLDVIRDYFTQNGNYEAGLVFGSIHNARAGEDPDGAVLFLMDAITNFAKFAGVVDTPTMLLEVSKHFEEGAVKYGENNWQKGIPAHCYVDSAVRHFLKWMRGDEDERHDRAFVWNVICCIWTIQNKPDLNDLKY